MNSMLVPSPQRGTKDQIGIHSGYEWIKNLPNKKIYFALFQNWHDLQDLPLGYDYYIVSFHLEAVNLNWLRQQRVPGQIIVLFDGNSYNLDIPGIHFIPFFYWHYQLEQMQTWFGSKPLYSNSPSYKFSAVCNRITQSKVWITTKLLETCRQSSLIVLNNWLEEKNVHNWQLTGNTVLDNLTIKFQERYLGQTIKIDHFDNTSQNHQQITATPWQPLYQDSAIHFTNESFHYSYTIDGNQSYIWPGPFITEKTLKCLLGGTAFVSVGQFEIYQILGKLGLIFDYGFDLTWDQDPGNLTRACSIVQLIDSLNQIEIDQLVKLTKPSNEHNQNYIVSRKFFDRCHKFNLESIEKIYQLLS
jgi:hypothetical protein